MNYCIPGITVGVASRYVDEPSMEMEVMYIYIYIYIDQKINNNYNHKHNLKLMHLLLRRWLTK